MGRLVLEGAGVAVKVLDFAVRGIEGVDIQSIAEDSQREDGYGESVAAIVRALKDLGYDLIVVFCLRRVRMVERV
jgi:hypothetical protein